MWWCGEIGLIMRELNREVSMGLEFTEKIKRLVKQLPRRACVAFAVRCARRVFPLFERWDREGKYVDAVKQANNVADEFAGSAADDATYAAIGTGFVNREVADVASRASVATEAASAAADETVATKIHDHNHGVPRGKKAACELAAAAGNAAHAAAAAANSAAYAAAAAGIYAIEAAASAAANCDIAIICEDAERLYTLSREEGWEDETPVEQFVFGAMWSGETPDWAKSESVETDGDAVELSIEIDGDLSDEEIKKKVLELIAQADGVHVEMGGGGLKIRDIDIESEKRARVGAPI